MFWIGSATLNNVSSVVRRRVNVLGEIIAIGDLQLLPEDGGLYVRSVGALLAAAQPTSPGSATLR